MNPPRNAAALITLRQENTVPDCPILVSLIGDLRYSNLTLYADAGTAYDWRCIAELEVEVFTSQKVPFFLLQRTLGEVSQRIPRRMILSFIEGPCIECGEARGVDDFLLFDWAPISVGWDYRAGKLLASALSKEFCKIDIYGEALKLIFEVKR